MNTRSRDDSFDARYAPPRPCKLVDRGGEGVWHGTTRDHRGVLMFVVEEHNQKCGCVELVHPTLVVFADTKRD